MHLFHYLFSFLFCIINLVFSNQPWNYTNSHKPTYVQTHTHTNTQMHTRIQLSPQYTTSFLICHFGLQSSVKHAWTGTHACKHERQTRWQEYTGTNRLANTSVWTITRGDQSNRVLCPVRSNISMCYFSSTCSKIDLCEYRLPSLRTVHFGKRSPIIQRKLYCVY